jgi:hypothetical protein
MFRMYYVVAIALLAKSALLSISFLDAYTHAAHNRESETRELETRQKMRDTRSACLRKARARL